VATYNTTFKLDDVRKLAEAKFEAVTVQQWQNICSHVEKIEVEYMKREYIVDEVEDLIISINGEESDESDFFHQMKNRLTKKKFKGVALVQI
jgi:hypothetical protein